MIAIEMKIIKYTCVTIDEEMYLLLGDIAWG